MSNILITGAAGFIGANFLYKWVDKFPNNNIIALDLLTYAGNYLTIKPLADQNKIKFIKGDICDSDLIKSVFKKYKIETVLNFAAESHVDRSIHNSKKFVTTNIVGTHVLLSEALFSWKNNFIGKHFHHISTDEVYGDLDENSPPFSEEASYTPNSPYSASKIAADQLAYSFFSSFDLPVVIVRPFNTFGPRQSARAVIPTIITQIANGRKKIKLGALTPTRDFNYVKDTVAGYLSVLNSEQGLGEVVNLGTNYEISIGKTAELIADLMGQNIEILSDEVRLRPKGSEVERLCADNTKAKEIFGWKPEYAGPEGLKHGIEETVKWFSEENHLRVYKSEIYNL